MIPVGSLKEGKSVKLSTVKNPRISKSTQRNQRCTGLLVTINLGCSCLVKPAELFSIFESFKLYDNCK